MARPIKYTVTDGKLVIALEVAEEGGYIVTVPMNPDVFTQADSMEEAFEMARDALIGSAADKRPRAKKHAAPTQYSATDGKLVLTLEVAEEGGFTVTSPFVPGLVTEGETLEEAFEMARDAEKSLKAARGRPTKRRLARMR